MKAMVYSKKNALSGMRLTEVEKPVPVTGGKVVIHVTP
jgi:hypothetical protein